VIAEQVEKISGIVSTISVESDSQAQSLGGMTNAVGQVSATADTNKQSVAEVSDVVSLIIKTAQGLDSIITHFKSNPGGGVEPPASQPGFIPPKGTFDPLRSS
jgi:methyl-accepting chemotaxis protein